MSVPSALIGVGGELLSSGKGGKKGNSASPNLGGAYKEWQGALEQAMNLYKTASGTGPDSLKAQDSRALAEYQKTALTQAQAMLGAYDASAAAGGSPVWQTDTNKERSRTQIAQSMATDVAGKQFAQTESLDARLQALLPNPSSYAQGFGGSGALDAANSAQQSNILDGILNLASLMPGNQGKTPSNPFDFSGYGNGGIPNNFSGGGTDGGSWTGGIGH